MCDVLIAASSALTYIRVRDRRAILRANTFEQMYSQKRCWPPLRFSPAFSFFKFHYADGTHWPCLVVDYIFRDPEISSGTTDAADDESTRAAWVMSSQAL
jgi:hypothetical protein